MVPPVAARRCSTKEQSLMVLLRSSPLLAGVVLLIGLPVFLALSSSATTTANAENITLPWCVPPADTDTTEYGSRLIKEGDTLYFDWDGEYHNVYTYPSSDCLDPKDREYLGEQSGLSYTFTADDVGKRKTFVCSVSNHCMAGQIISFGVVPIDESISYDLSTPCGEAAYFGRPPTEAPTASPTVPESSSSNGKMVPGRFLAMSAFVVFLAVTL